MRGSLTVATRIWSSLRGDPRTLGLVFVAPVFLIFLFDLVLDQVPQGRFRADFVRPVLLGIFSFSFTYILTAVGFLRERQSGTLERLFASRIQRTGVVLGYTLGLGILALVQSTVILATGYFILDVRFEHGLPLFFLVTVLGALSALGIGLLLSLAARNEFQVFQFIPLVLAPQFILGGVFVPVEALPWLAEVVANALPLTYLLQGMNWIVLGIGSWEDFWIAIGMLGAWTVGTIGLASAVIRPST